MALSWKKISLIGLAFAALSLLGWQVSGQSPDEKSTLKESQTEVPVTREAPTGEPAAKEKVPQEKPAIEEAPIEEPVARPPTAEPTAEKSDPNQTPEPKPKAEEPPVATPAEKPIEKPAQTQPPEVKRAPPPPKPAPRPTPPLFGTTTTAHADLTPFPQWTGSLARYYQQRSQVPGPCQATAFNRCHMQRWQEMLQEVSSETRERQLNRVNLYMNTHRYIVDPINWGVNEYWAIPQEFLRKFGDCEDYAIAKYLSLRAMGWSADAMRIVVVQDMNLRVMHAILIVNFQGKNMLLDNQITLVIDAKKVHHYTPIYSLNEKGWWRHSRVRRPAG